MGIIWRRPIVGSYRVQLYWLVISFSSCLPYEWDGGSSSLISIKDVDSPTKCHEIPCWQRSNDAAVQCQLKLLKQSPGVLELQNYPGVPWPSNAKQCQAYHVDSKIDKIG